ncbi:MAG: phenylalanine--tRNA ligase subunit alpha [bacterium]|nr:phenylalanine--tRNA ligase subunit alpha [bacterium]
MDESYIKGLHPLESKIILSFKTCKQLKFSELVSLTGLSEPETHRAIQWLITKKIISVIKRDVKRNVTLTELGNRYAREGLPEVKIINLLKKKDAVKLTETGLASKEISEAIGYLKSAGIINIETGMIKLRDPLKINNGIKGQKFIDKIRGRTINFDELSNDEQSIVKSMSRKRGKTRGVFRVDEREEFTYKITDLGKAVLKILIKKVEPSVEVSQLTPSLLKDGSWKGKVFREYNIDIKPPRIVIGKPHPYREFLDRVREKLISMGFCEVSGELVENEFWNMDALFMPQFHSAREIHGIYFIRSPKYSKEIEPKILGCVAQTHQDGWHTGSRGWGYKFDRERAKRLILRSHGTALSVRTLALHPNPPGKYFAIARCFRPDPVDAAHAPDFFQIEGIVVSKDANFRSLLGLLKLFGTEIAQSNEIKFIPGYFPFTEPSVELHAKHPKLGWVELGGAGIFRPEVTMPLGVNVPVLAWGLGLDRMAMMVLDIHDIRDLFSQDLNLIRKKCQRLLSQKVI